MINTVIINPQKQDVEQIVSLLSSAEDINVLAQGKDGYDALRLIGSLKPDIAILDTHLDFIGGAEIPPLLKTRSPLTAVVILTSRISDYQLYKAALNEVSGFVHKDTDMDMLPEILKCISGGGCFISPNIAARVLRFFSPVNREFRPAFPCDIEASAAKGSPHEYLSKVEIRILAYIGEGRTSGEIADKLGFTVGTVRNYISSIMHKTGMCNRSQMARYALSYGLVSLNSG